MINLTEKIDRSVKPIEIRTVVLTASEAKQIMKGEEIFYDGFCFKCLSPEVTEGKQTLVFLKV